MLDLNALLSQVMESKIASIMYQNMQTSAPRRYRPDSTRLAFDNQMRADSGMFRQSTQNMKDAMAMVEVAQSGVTAIKNHLGQMHKMATEMATYDGMNEAQYENYSNMLKEQANLIVGLAENIEFNGMKLLNGTAGMNNDGTVVLSAGGNPMNQVFTNMLNANSDSVLADDGSMNLNLLKDELNITSKEEAAALVEKLNSYTDRMLGLEGDYSYDIKALENLSVLFENRADIFENAIQYKNEEEQDEPEERTVFPSYLESLMMGSGNIFSAKG